MRVGLLASGSGTIADAICDAGVPVVVLLVDRACGALDIAASHGVPGELLERTSYGRDFDRDAYTERVVKVLEGYDVDVVAMAGFGTILGPAMFRRWPGAVLNTHPALLPAFPGWHAVRDALAYGAKVTGCTVHIATEEVDHGPVLAQEAVPVLPDDTESTLHERIKQVERVLYPRAIKEFTLR
ncbi:MAG: phosphoribosylglycinamide formyltransferase [Acidimicrobiia bacterium]